MFNWKQFEKSIQISEFQFYSHFTQWPNFFEIMDRDQTIFLNCSLTPFIQTYNKKHESSQFWNPYSLVWLLIVPSGHSKQSKQHTGLNLFMALRVPGGHGSLHTDLGIWLGKTGHVKTEIAMLTNFIRNQNCHSAVKGPRWNKITFSTCWYYVSTLLLHMWGNWPLQRVQM